MTEKQAVAVVEADVLDRMNETRSLIAQRAYEIYESRGGRHGSDQGDWFSAEQEIVPRIDVDYHTSDKAIRLTARVPGFAAKDLEVVVGHQRAVLCGVEAVSKHGDGVPGHRRVMRVIELPFRVDPAGVRATLSGGTLEVVLPRAA